MLSSACEQASGIPKKILDDKAEELRIKNEAQKAIQVSMQSTCRTTSCSAPMLSHKVQLFVPARSVDCLPLWAQAWLRCCSFFCALLQQCKLFSNIGTVHSDGSRVSTSESCMASVASSHMPPVDIVQKRYTGMSILQRSSPKRYAALLGHCPGRCLLTPHGFCAAGTVG